MHTYQLENHEFRIIVATRAVCIWFWWCNIRFVRSMAEQTEIYNYSIFYYFTSYALESDVQGVYHKPRSLGDMRCIGSCSPNMVKQHHSMQRYILMIHSRVCWGNVYALHWAALFIPENFPILCRWSDALWSLLAPSGHN